LPIVPNCISTENRRAIRVFAAKPSKVGPRVLGSGGPQRPPISCVFDANLGECRCTDSGVADKKQRRRARKRVASWT
jgi:hypothetical protein